MGWADLSETESSLRRVTDARAALGAFVALEASAFPLLLWLGRRAWFTDDDWDFFSTRTAGNVSDLFRPHFQHWTTLPILTYRLMFAVVGLHSYVPYQALVVALHLTAAALLRTLMRRAGVRPWTATVFAGAFLFLGAGAENILVAFQIAFVGAFVCGLVQLLLADHDGPLGRRDVIGLVAGLAGLMFSGVAITMVVIVGMAVLVRRGRRGWRAALFHTVPLAVAYLAWSQLAPKGRSPNVYKSRSLRQIVEFVIVGVRSSFGGLGRVVGLGAAFGLLLVVGLVLMLRTRGARALRGSAAAVTALLAGALVFLVVTGLARSGQPAILRAVHGTGPDRAKESRYQYLVVAMALPAIALGADAVTRRWRRLAIPVLALPLVSLPWNLHVLEHYSPRYRTLPFERTQVLSLPHVALVSQFRHSHVPVPLPRLAAQGLTIGWIADSASALPSPGRVDASQLATTTLRFALARAPHRPGTCAPLRAGTARLLERRQTLTIAGGRAFAVYLPAGSPPSMPVALWPSTVVALAGPLPLHLAPWSAGVMLCE